MKNLVVSKICITFANEIRNDKEFFENIMTEVQIMKIGSTPWCNGSTLLMHAITYFYIGRVAQLVRASP